MKRNISFIIAFFTIGLVLLFFSKCTGFKRNNDSSDSFVDYHLVEMGKYARVVKLNHPNYSHRVYFSDDRDRWPINESVIGPCSHYDYIQERVFAGRDRSNTFWFVKKGAVHDTLLYRPWFNTAIEFQSGLFPTKLLFSKEDVEINTLLSSDTSVFNNSYYGFYLDFYQGHIYLKSLGCLTIIEIERRGVI